MTSPTARKLGAVSPTRLHSLRDCFLQVAFSEAASSTSGGNHTDAQLVGDVSHATLEWLVKSGAPYEARHASVAEHFQEELQRRAPGREVGGARPATARLRKVAARIVALLDEAGADADVRTERRLHAAGSALVGIVDLAIASAALHVVVDYKTGRTLDETGTIARHIEDQLAIYCVLEHEATRTWPGRAIVMPFRAAPIEWEVDPDVCEAVAADAIELREKYETHLGSIPPAAPSPDVCRFCTFAPRCNDFWEKRDSSWDDVVQGVRGQIEWAQRTAAGDITVALTSCAGTQANVAVVRQVPGALLTDTDLEPGTQIAFVGVWTDEEGRFRAGRNLRCWIDGDADGAPSESPTWAKP